MNAKFKEAVERRKKQARRRVVWHKASRVARCLGSDLDSGSGGGVSERTFTYENTCLSLKVVYLFGETSCSDGTSGHRNLQVYHQDKLVFQEGGSDGCVDIGCYIPGKWEQFLNNLQPEAKTQEKMLARMTARKRTTTDARTKNSERAKWGL